VNAYITPSTEDVAKTIAKRTRYYYATSLPVKSSYVKGDGVRGMVITGSTLTGDCSIKYVEAPQSMGGNKPEVRFISDTIHSSTAVHRSVCDERRVEELLQRSFYCREAQDSGKE